VSRVLFLLFVFPCFFVVAAPLQYLTKYTVEETNFENPTANTWDAGDDQTSNAINIGFTFRFNNTNYTQLYINSNGILIFGNNKPSDNGHYNNEPLEYNGNRFDHSIYPYWDDLYRRTGQIQYATLGNASNRHFVIKWSHVKHYSNSGDYTFEVVLYEDGAIRFRYDDDADGTSYNGSDPGATIGVQEDTSHFDEHSYNSVINQNQDILYIPNPINIMLPPTSCTKIQKIALSTYDTNGYADSYPDSVAEYQTWIVDNALASKLFGNGYVDNINVSSVRDNNPYHSGTDEYYLAIFKGYIYLPETGIYKFGIDGDDAVEVYIDDTLITSWYSGHARAGHATRIRYVSASSGYHKIEYHMQEREGGDSYYLYWQRPLESSITIVPALRFFHCIASLAKTSCVISDPVNGTGNGVSPVKLDFHTVSAGTIKCGYFEVGLSR